MTFEGRTAERMIDLMDYIGSVLWGMFSYIVLSLINKYVKY